MSLDRTEHTPARIEAVETRRSEPASLVFEALIAPHRSLGRRGSAVLLGAIALASSCIALRFCFIGAWPVLAFSGAEVLLASILLTLNIRCARAQEIIRLSTAEITVVRTDRHGRRSSFSLPSAWLQVTLETIGEHGSRLLLRSHGRRREVGDFLHAPEKLSLFEALRDALQGVRHPHFDNTQLRDG